MARFDECVSPFRPSYLQLIVSHFSIFSDTKKAVPTSLRTRVWRRACVLSAGFLSQLTSAWIQLDYLSTYSKFLLRATDRQTGTFALSHSRPYLLPAHEDALCHIADLLQTFLADADSVSLPRMHQSPRDLKFVGVQTQTTRGGAFSPAEHEEWTCDLNRTAVSDFSLSFRPCS